MAVKILCVGGLDPAGCAGITADSNVVNQLGGHALTVASSLTVQTENTAFQSKSVPNGLLTAQLTALLSSQGLTPNAVKVGLIQDSRHWFAVRNKLPKQLPLVIDPVLKTSSGLSLSNAGRKWCRGFSQLASQATLITPNAEEWPQLKAVIPKNVAVLVTGTVKADQIHNQLWRNNRLEETFVTELLPGEFRGTGCRLSSAIAFYLGSGHGLSESIELAMAVLNRAIQNSHALGTASVPYLNVND